MRTKPGEIWLADLGLAAKTRPVLIVSREDADPPRVLLLYVPLTRQYRGSDYEVEMKDVRFLNEVSYANVQGLGSLPAARLERLLGKISPELFGKVKTALRFALDL
ncbi:MAG TPA: type II toxin-antitoxin system PemK/MazF family toxin [Candidatus Methylacidiphilales bacterium]|jgi:mRNA interferase MazF|nr:type II toxin-antitoxin system PemK/MazF family toxin [Candidatus Methylacidiphilales bacterium]